MEPEILLKVAKKRGLNGVAITDHNKIEGALKVKQINKDTDFEVIIGSEILTAHGELLAYNLQEQVKTKNIFEAIDHIKDQDATIAIAHPFAILRAHLKGDIKEIIKKVDAIECFNSRNFFDFADRRAIKLAKGYKKAKIGSSDSHFYFEIGNARTIFQGSLSEAIKERKTTYYGKKANFFLVAANSIRNRSFGLRK